MYNEYHLPRSLATRSLGASFRITSIVLLYASIWIDGEANVRASFKFGIRAAKQVAAEKLALLKYVIQRLQRTTTATSGS